MKALKFLTAVFTVCFLAGLVIAGVSPQPVLADNNPCNPDCYIFNCGPGSCPPGSLPIGRWHQSALLADCWGPFTCKFVQTGCGDCF